MRHPIRAPRRPGRARTVGLGLALLLSAAPALAAGWPPGGRAIAQHGLPARGVPACSACHGPRFRGGTAPALAGRDATLLMDRLAAIAASPGGDPAMRHAARAMSMAGRAAVSTYLARLPRAR